MSKKSSLTLAERKRARYARKLAAGICSKCPTPAVSRALCMRCLNAVNDAWFRRKMKKKGIEVVYA